MVNYKDINSVAPETIQDGDKFSTDFPGYPGDVFCGTVTDITDNRVTLTAADGAHTTIYIFGAK